MQQPNWKPGETTETARPEEIIMGTGRIKVRRNITRETRTTETGKQKVWVYEYADMTLAQYEEYAAEVAQLDTPLARQRNSTAGSCSGAVRRGNEDGRQPAGDHGRDRGNLRTGGK